MRCSRFLGQILPAENPYGNQRGDCQDGEADRCEGDGGGPGRDACQGVPADLGADLHEQGKKPRHGDDWQQEQQLDPLEAQLILERHVYAEEKGVREQHGSISLHGQGGETRHHQGLRQEDQAACQVEDGDQAVFCRHQEPARIGRGAEQGQGLGALALFQENVLHGHEKGVYG